MTSSDDLNVPHMISIHQTAGQQDREVLEALMVNSTLRNIAQRRIGERNRFCHIFCGKGGLTNVLSQIYPKSHGFGIDTNKAAITHATSKVASIVQAHGRLSFLNVDPFQGEGWPKGTFDLIFISQVLPFVTDPKQLLAMVYGKLSPGGKVWIRDTNPEWFIKAIFHEGYGKMAKLYFQMLSNSGVDIHHFSHLATDLSAAGFENVKFFREDYHITSNNFPGQWAFSVLQHTVYSARELVVESLKGTEGEVKLSDYEAWNTDLLKKAPGLIGKISYPVYVAERP